MKRNKAARDVDIHNGFGEWDGYMNAKIAKLEEQYADSALRNPYKESDLFAGISIYVNGLTNPSADELKRIMMKNGGVYHTYQRQWTTFIIAANLPDVKVRQITSAKIISPQWIVDCLKETRILDYSKYLLYTNCKVSQPKLMFTSKKTVVSTSARIQNDDQSIFVDMKHTDSSNVEVDEMECDDIEPNYAQRVPTTSLVKSINDEIGPDPTQTDEEKPVDFMQNLNLLNTLIRDNDTPTKPAEKQPTLNNSIKTDEPRKNAARTAVDPNFLAEFYNNSRLHHIATLGASFKQKISKLRESHNGLFPARDLLKPTLIQNANSVDIDGNVIMHIDMDCFFVSVGLRSRPHLKGFPIAVTHSKGSNVNNIKNINEENRRKEMAMYVKNHEDRFKKIQSKFGDDSDEKPNDNSMAFIEGTSSLSEIASCSYEARKMGIKNGMFVGAALKLCPNLKTIPYDFDSYKEVAHILYETITQYTLDVEAVSCDEMYVNLADVVKVLGCSVDDFVTHIRNEIIEKTQCPCSAGIGENKLQARMATKKAKPNGQFHLLVENVEEYFRNIEISDLPGVGYSTSQKLANLQIRTCAELQLMAIVNLQQDFGRKLGETLYQYCRGIDNKPLTYNQIRKSVSAEVNYGIRFTEECELETFLHQLCVEVHNRLMEIEARGKTITLKYMVRAAGAPVETAKFMGHGYCDHITKSITLQQFTANLTLITQTVFNIKNILKILPKELRGIGIQISKLNTNEKDTNKSNALRNLFEKQKKVQKPVEAKQKLTTTENHDKLINHGQSLRRVKSFGGTPSPGPSHKFRPSQKLHKIYEELDLDVLAELPEDIREEIILEQKRILHKNDRPATNVPVMFGQKTRRAARNLESDYDSNEPKGDASSSFFLPPPNTAEISEGNILNSSDWIRTMSKWLGNNVEPASCDVEMISGFFVEYARAQKLTELMLFMKYLHRKIDGMNCAWHRVYYKIFNAIQEQIALIFGKKFRLYIKPDFDCFLCQD